MILTSFEERISEDNPVRFIDAFVKNINLKTLGFELQWLLFGLVPHYHSISDFRKNNPCGLKKLFKVFVAFLKDTDLIEGKTIHNQHRMKSRGLTNTNKHVQMEDFT